MTGDNLTALKLRPQAQRTERASGLPGLGIPEMEAKRYEGKIKAGAVSEWGELRPQSPAHLHSHTGDSP
jgi:hypothetical protein